MNSKIIINNNINILVDQRERKVIPEFEPILNNNYKNLNVEIKIATLTTADYAITYKDNILILIERKTWKDLSSTFKDKKRRSNYKKMLDEKNKHKSCILVAYIIEGKFYTNRKTKICKIPFSSLQCHLDHLMLEHGIYILKSKNRRDTAYRIIELTKNITTMESNPIKKIDNQNIIQNIEGAYESLTKNKKPSEEDINFLLWSSVRGISESVANELIKNKLDIKKIILGEYSFEQIKDYKYPSGLIFGEERSKKIIKKYTSLLKDNNKAISFLSAIPGISKNMLGKILEKVSLNEIIENIRDGTSQKLIENISIIQLSSKRKIGKAIPIKIIKYLS